MARVVKAEELLDVQQQADFFVSLGQHEQAIEVLRSHIGDNVETSALVYLDLFSIYHQLKRRSDYEALRIEFNNQFNAKIPAFERYTDTGPGLESHPFALSRIQALWPSPKVLEVIEESIFKRPGADTEAFDLESYRELLLLYAVAKEIAGTEVLPSNGMKNFDVTPAEEVFDFGALKFRATAIQPLLAGMDEGNGGPLVTAVLTPVPLALLSLDLDLSEPANSSEISLSGIESDSIFFAQFANTAPNAPPVFLATPGSAAHPSPDVDNLIDFDPYDSGVKR